MNLTDTYIVLAAELWPLKMIKFFLKTESKKARDHSFNAV